MNKLKNILNRVNNIISNSNNDTLDEIKNISDILEVDGKIASILHFAHKDGHWNPNTLTLLEDITKELKPKGEYINYTPEKKTRN